MRFFDARINHFDKDIWILVEFNHQLLVLLHLAERVFIYLVRIVEKQVVLTCELNFNILKLVAFISL